MRGQVRQRTLFAGSGAILCAVALLSAACGAFSIGRSVDGRELAVMTFGDGPRAVLLVGGLHTGGEDNSRIIAERIALHVAQHPDVVPASITLYILPSANPDGTARGIHTNAHGVDLNRNWPADDWVADACHPATGCRHGLGGPAPLSEPETSALYGFIEGMRPELTLVWHAEAPLVEANEVAGADVYGRAFADAAGYPYVEEWTAYRITGQLIDALEQRLRLRAIDVELSECCGISAAEFDRNVRGLEALLAAIDGKPAPQPNATCTPAPKPKANPTPSDDFLVFPTPRPINRC